MNTQAPQGQDVNSGADTSAAPQSDVNTQAEPSQSASPDVNVSSDSSADTGVKQEGPKSLSDLIKDGLTKLTGKDPAEATPAKGEKDPVKQDTQQDEKPAGEETSEAEKNAPAEIHTHPAFKAVVAERKKARAERDEVIQKLETLQPDANRYQQLQTYLKTNGVSQTDAAEALKTVALAYTNPQQFYEKLVGLAREWGEHLGATLPPDLQQEVDEGLISQERAAELAKVRGQVNVATEQTARYQQAQTQQNQQQEYQYRVQLFTNWADQISKTDPELNKKIPMITERLNYLLQTEGDPNTPQAAWDRLTRVHKEVTERLRSFSPPRQITQPSPRSTGTPQGVVTPPSTYEEAMATAFQNLRSKTI